MIALQLVEAALASAAGDLQTARELNRQAISSVRAEIEELRLGLGEAHGSFAMGFVLRPEQTTRALGALSPESQSTLSPESQSKPRRTA